MNKIDYEKYFIEQNKNNINQRGFGIPVFPDNYKFSLSSMKKSLSKRKISPETTQFRRKRVHKTNSKVKRVSKKRTIKKSNKTIKRQKSNKSISRIRKVKRKKSKSGQEKSLDIFS